MNDYTPTTDDIEDAWCSRYDGEHSWASGEERRGYEDEFNRWLEQVKAEAWDVALADAYRIASATAARTQSIDAILASLAPRRKEENND